VVSGGIKTVLEVIETYLIGGAVGFVVGVIVSRIYFKSKIESKTIGHMIEYAMIRQNVTQLSSMTASLSKLVAGISECSEEITEQLEIIKDIEEDLSRTEKKEGGY
jgi:peptidoglycan hydrolase CwlO-like protein